jgi:hypothetical protein
VHHLYLAIDGVCFTVFSTKDRINLQAYGKRVIEIMVSFLATVDRVICLVSSFLAKEFGEMLTQVPIVEIDSQRSSVIIESGLVMKVIGLNTGAIINFR